MSNTSVRKFKTMSAARDVAKTAGKEIVWKQWSNKDQCMLVIFGDYQYKSQLMRGAA